jgi:hypothetical protein
MGKGLAIIIRLFVKLQIKFVVALLYLIKFKIQTRNKWVLGRVACLGIDVFKLLNLNYRLYNVQKGRIDYLSESIVKGQSIIAPSLKLLKYINRKDIQDLILVQYFLKFNLISPPEFMIIDSYSELTDQKFIDKDNLKSYFFANYSDVNAVGKEILICEGLMDTDEQLKKYYLDFFLNFRKIYPATPIIYINFPKKLDSREKFIIRHNQIKGIIYDVAKSINFMHVFDIPEEIISSSSTDSFPYHYNDEVYTYLAQKLSFIKR